MTQAEQAALIRVLERYIDDRVGAVEGKLQQVMEIYRGTPEEIRDALERVDYRDVYGGPDFFEVLGVPTHPRVWMYVQHLMQEVRRLKKDADGR